MAARRMWSIGPAAMPGRSGSRTTWRSSKQGAALRGRCASSWAVHVSAVGGEVSPPATGDRRARAATRPMPEYVVTRTHQEPRRENATSSAGDVATEATRLKEQAATSTVYGSADRVQGRCATACGRPRSRRLPRHRVAPPPPPPVVTPPPEVATPASAAPPLSSGDAAPGDASPAPAAIPEAAHRTHGAHRPPAWQRSSVGLLIGLGSRRTGGWRVVDGCGSTSPRDIRRPPTPAGVGGTLMVTSIDIGGKHATDPTPIRVVGARLGPGDRAYRDRREWGRRFGVDPLISPACQQPGLTPTILICTAGGMGSIVARSAAAYDYPSEGGLG